jgi:hypothetical protein
LLSDLPRITGQCPIRRQTSSQLPKQRSETEFVKDEYFVYNVENSDNSDHIEKFTHDYFEYELGHANIIVKGRLKSNIQFWIEIGASCVNGTPVYQGCWDPRKGGIGRT